MPRKKKELVTRASTASLSNVLNEMFFDKIMTLQELRFFLIYLSKINPKEPDKTEISFTLEDYSKILGVELNEKEMDRVTTELLGRVVNVRPDVLSEDVVEEVIKTPLFKRCRMFRRKSDNKWYLTFECSEDVKPHIFKLTKKFTSLEIWNIINLGNFQDARMYMLMRQYRKIGERTIGLKELKEMLGIDVNSYPQYKIFARDVLKKCQKSLAQYTDIRFEFSAVGRPAKAVHFDIYTNKHYKLPKFLEEETEDPNQISLFDGVPEEVPEEDPLRLSMDALPPELTRAQIEALRELALPHMPYEHVHTLEDKELWLYHYFKQKTALMKADPAVRNPFKWLKRAVAEDWK